MKKAVVCGILSIFMLIGFTNCTTGNNETDGVTDETDKITIISVSPNTGLKDGQETNFTVTFDYNLVTQSQGEISIGFNNRDRVDTWYHVEDKIQVQKGRGRYVIHTNGVEAKNWGENGDFSVSVNLIPYPRPAGDTVRSLAGDRYILKF